MGFRSPLLASFLVAHARAGAKDDWNARLGLATASEWEFKGAVDDDDSDALFNTNCNLQAFEAFDLLPPEGARSHPGAEGLEAFAPTLDLQLRTTGWTDAGTGYANLSWAAGLDAADTAGEVHTATVKRWINYYSFTARALPLLEGVTEGDVALPALQADTHNLLFGFWYRPSPDGDGVSGYLYTYGVLSDAEYDLKHGFELTIAPGTRSVSPDTRDALITLEACLPEGASTLCKETKWEVSDLDEEEDQKHSSWMHLVVGVSKEGGAVLWSNGASATRACSSHENIEVGGETTTECFATCFGTVTDGVCEDKVSAHTVSVFGVDYLDGNQHVDGGFPANGNVFPAEGDAIRYLGGISGVGDKASASGWYADPVARILGAMAHDPSDAADGIDDGLAEEVTALRSGMGTYGFLNFSTFMSGAEQLACAEEGKDLVTNLDPVGLSCFPTAPLSCVAVPHGAHVCAIEASTAFFETACLQSSLAGSTAPPATCGDPCRFDFNNDGTFDQADVDWIAGGTPALGAANANSDAATASATLVTLTAEGNTACHPYFSGLVDGYFASGRKPEEISPALYPMTQCRVSTPAYTLDDLNYDDASCESEMLTSAAVEGVMTRVVEAAKSAFGQSAACTLPTPCDATASACTLPSAPPIPPSLSPPPPASPPSPPPSYPSLPSVEEWIDILSALFNWPTRLVAVINAFVAVVTVTVFEPIDEIFGVFAPLVRADGRFRQRLCALYPGFKVCD